MLLDPGRDRPLAVDISEPVRPILELPRAMPVPAALLVSATGESDRRAPGGMTPPNGVRSSI